MYKVHFQNHNLLDILESLEVCTIKNTKIFVNQLFFIKHNFDNHSNALFQRRYL